MSCDIVLSGLSTQLGLSETLDCGQAFRWRPYKDGYEGVAFGKRLYISAQGDNIVLHNTSQEEYEQCWKKYLDLERNYDELRKLYSSDSVLTNAMSYAQGIRVLNQDPWETMITFIISSNNNIARIKGIVERLCQCFGEELGDEFYAFPTAEMLAIRTEEELAPLRCGYRSKFILDAAKKVADGELDLCAVSNMDTEQAKKALMSVNGIGPKVADCTLLFGFGRVECFPMDTWMKKVMGTLYPNGLPQPFVPTAGIAQQYLFHYARNHGELFTTNKEKR